MNANACKGCFHRRPERRAIDRLEPGWCFWYIELPDHGECFLRKEDPDLAFVAEEDIDG